MNDSHDELEQLSEGELLLAALVRRGRRARALFAALDHLSPRDRRLIELRFFKGMTATAAARELGMSPVAGHVAFLRALYKLRKAMDEASWDA